MLADEMRFDPEVSRHLTNIPKELLEDILDKSDWRDVLRWETVCRQIRAVIIDSCHLQHQRELGAAQHVDAGKKRGRSRAKALETLKMVENRWAMLRLAPLGVLCTPSNRVGSPSKAQCEIFRGTIVIADRNGHIFRTSLPFPNDILSRHDTPATHHIQGKGDPGPGHQFGLSIVSDLFLDLHSESLDGWGRFPQRLIATASTVSRPEMFPPSFSSTVTDESDEGYSFALAGEWLLTMDHRDDERRYARVHRFNWRTGFSERREPYHRPGLYSPGICFITPDVYCIFRLHNWDCTGESSLELCRMTNGHDRRTRFVLPRLREKHMFDNIICISPSSLEIATATHQDRHDLGSEYPSFRDSSCQILVLELQSVPSNSRGCRRTGQVSRNLIVVDSSALIRLASQESFGMESRDSEPLSIAWEDWGPHHSRFIEHRFGRSAVHGTRLLRTVTLSEDHNGEADFEVELFDFNPYAGRHAALTNPKMFDSDDASHASDEELIVAEYVPASSPSLLAEPRCADEVWTSQPYWHVLRRLRGKLWGSFKFDENYIVTECDSWQPQVFGFHSSSYMTSNTEEVVSESNTVPEVVQ